MAQLVGMNAKDDVDIKFSFKVASSFDEKTPDGWGYAFYRNNEWQIFKQSIDMEKILRIDTKTLTPHKFTGNSFIAHVRIATHGVVSYDNTHPFDRELFDKMWVFAHHGHLRIYRQIIESHEIFKPNGDTDSEAAFCTILEDIRGLGRKDEGKELAKVIEKRAIELSKQGGMNFLLSNGDIMYAFYSGYRSLYYATLRPPFEEYIKAEDDQVKFSLKTVNLENPITILSSGILNKDLEWKEFDQRTLYVFKNGERVKHVY